MDEVTDNDKLLAALAYIFSPLSPIIIMFILEDKKDRPFIKAHNMQALVLGSILLVLSMVLSWTCVFPIASFGLVLYLGYRAYQGEEIVLPFITDFVKNQGWV